MCAISRMRFAHAPPQQLGPRSYPLYSSASVHSRGKTLVFPRLRQFLALQLSCPTNLCKETNFLLIQLLKNFKNLMLLLFLLLKNFKNLMLLLFLCLGTVPISSCQPSCCAPPSSGCAMAASSHLSTALWRSLRRLAAWTPLLHHQGWVAGRDRLHQPPQGLHRSGCHTWQSAIPQPTTRQVPRWSCHHQAGLFFRPAGFFIFFQGGAKRQSRNCFLVADRFFCMPWTGSAIPVSTAAVPAPSAVTVSESGPLTSPPAGRRQSSGRALWRPAMPLVDGQTSWPCTLATLYTVYSPCI